MHNGRSLTHSEHRRHDRLLVARFAMADAYPGERDEALKMIESCAECAALAADVRTVATAMPRLPVAPRTRDFTISAEQAEKVRGSGLARWLRTLAMPSWGALRPVAGVVLSIGLVMAVVGAGIPGMQPATQFTQEPTEQGASPANAPEPAATKQAQAPEVDNSGVEPPERAAIEQASPDPISDLYNQAYVEPSPDADDAPRDVLSAAAPANPTRDLLIYGGLMIATLSLALLALAWIARRRFADPLLR